MNIFIEGPCWVGMWTEIIADALRSSGHRVGCSYHNRKTLRDRVALAGATRWHGNARNSAWKRRHRQQLVQVMAQSRWDILLSIQGPLDRQTAQQLREHSPQLRIIYWWGDILTAQAQSRLEEAAGFADKLLLSYMGSYQALKPVYGDRLYYFPFGVSSRFHTIGEISALDRKRYGTEVALVGSYYPERCELVRYLNSQLDAPVSVWGRGWYKCPGIRHHRALTLADSLKVYRCSRISLNLHHIDTPNGFNMKFYEIPAAGGFQICNWQAQLDATELGRHTVACRSLPEFAAQVNYYLAHEHARKEIIAATTQAALTTTAYQSRLDKLLEQIPGQHE